MEFHIELYHLFGIAVVLIGAYFSLVKLIVKQFNDSLTKRFEGMEKARHEAAAVLAERFEAIEAQRVEATKAHNLRFDRIEANQKTLDRDVLLLKAELPERYVRREDAIRSEMTLHAKFDGLAAQIYSFMRGKEQ